MEHADIETTRKYLHLAPRPDDAALVAQAFEVAPREALRTATSAVHGNEP